MSACCRDELNSEYTPWLDTHQASVIEWMKARKILARNLKRLRNERDLSQEELAHRAQIDRTYASAIERCLYAASVDVLERLAAALSVEIDELLKQRDR